MISIVFMPVAMVIAHVLTLLIRFVLMAADLLASFPLAAVYTASPYITIWLIFSYVLVFVLLVSQKRAPGMVIGCITWGLCAALLASWAEPMLFDTRMMVLDVGQGQSILLQSQGKNFLVDCGGDSDEETADIISEALLSQGITELDGILLTHYDRDHAGALENLLTRIDTKLLLLPAVS